MEDKKESVSVMLQVRNNNDEVEKKIRESIKLINENVENYINKEELGAFDMAIADEYMGINRNLIDLHRYIKSMESRIEDHS